VLLPTVLPLAVELKSHQLCEELKSNVLKTYTDYFGPATMKE